MCFFTPYKFYQLNQSRIVTKRAIFKPHGHLMPCLIPSGIPGRVRYPLVSDGCRLHDDMGGGRIGQSRTKGEEDRRGKESA